MGNCINIQKERVRSFEEEDKLLEKTPIFSQQVQKLTSAEIYDLRDSCKSQRVKIVLTKEQLEIFLNNVKDLQSGKIVRSFKGKRRRRVVGAKPTPFFPILTLYMKKTNILEGGDIKKCQYELAHIVHIKPDKEGLRLTGS
ncbi:hypothetical protein KY285_006680 [Solanum tuberosum]|nr:hypothetical protein KY285_006680 [Solanum tuberosum]